MTPAQLSERSKAAARSRARLALANPGRLPRRQRELLSFIGIFFDRHGCGPNYAQMRSFMGFASNGPLVPMLLNLQVRGFIARSPYRRHGIRPIKQPSAAFRKTLSRGTKVVVGLNSSACRCRGACPQR